MKKYKEIINEVNHELTKYEEIVKKRDINKGYEEYINIPLLVNKTNIYKEYSLYQDLLNEEIYETIEDTYSLSINEKKFKFIKNKKNKYINNLNIFLIDQNNEFDKEEEKEVIKKIKLHYAIKIKEVNKKIFIVNISSLICLIIGLIIMGLYALFNLYLKYAFSEMISIFGWVFIWEACDLFCFTNLFNKKDKLKYIRLFNASYNFKDLYEIGDIKDKYLKY